MTLWSSWGDPAWLTACWNPATNNFTSVNCLITQWGPVQGSVSCQVGVVLWRIVWSCQNTADDNWYWWMLINPFTAMLAAPSLGKRWIKVPDLKSSTPPTHTHTFAWAHEKDFYENLQYWKYICVIVLSNKLFAGVYLCTFKPRNFTGWSSEGVKHKSCSECELL